MKKKIYLTPCFEVIIVILLSEKCFSLNGLEFDAWLGRNFKFPSGIGIRRDNGAEPQTLVCWLGIVYNVCISRIVRWFLVWGVLVVYVKFLGLSVEYMFCKINNPQPTY